MIPYLIVAVAGAAFAAIVKCNSDDNKGGKKRQREEPDQQKAM